MYYLSAVRVSSDGLLSRYQDELAWINYVCNIYVASMSTLIFMPYIHVHTVGPTWIKWLPMSDRADHDSSVSFINQWLRIAVMVSTAHVATHRHNN